jgi:restriction endonuclease S subunit
MEPVINKIREILRKEGITGMDSINHCIIFVIARMLNKEKCKKYNIDEKFSYENILVDDDGDEIGDQELYGRIYTKNKVECLVGQIVNKLGFLNIKFKLESIVHVKQIMKTIQKLNFDDLELKYDIIGTIYEYHLKSGTSNAMRDLGQYYTNRQVINYMIKLCDPKMDKKGNIETIIDPTMGTGGFLTMSIKYLNDKYNNKIDWSKNKQHIYGFDIDENVKNMALLNILLESGELCNDTIIKNDTLYNDFKLKDNTVLEKVDIILANEPMGIKNIIHASCCNRIKELKMRGTKAEPLFLQLFMESLNDGGRCAVIVPDGVLFNDSNLHNDTRKYLIENFNLKKVVSLNDDFFLNTGVKTSILYFVNDGKTSEVEFSELKLNKDILTENSIIKVDYKKIKELNYTLFVNKYNTKEIEKIEGVEYKKLGDIVEKQSGKSLSKNNMVDGIYPVIGGGVDFGGFHNEFNYDDELLIIARVGSAGHISKYKGKCYITDLVGAYKNKNNSILFNYIYYYLKYDEDNIKDNYVVKTGAPSINLANFLDKYEIPIPSLLVQKKIVEQLDILSQNIQTSKQQIEESKKILKYYVETMTLWDDTKKMGDICDLKIGGTPRRDTNKYWDNGNNIWVSVSELNHNVIMDSKEKITDDGVKNSNVKLIKKDSILMSFKMSVGKKAIAGTDLYTNEAIVSMNGKNNIISNKYIYHLIDQFDFSEACSSIGGGNLNKEKIENLKIKVPSLEKQKQIVSYCDNIDETIKIMKNKIYNNEQLMKFIIETYLNNKVQIENNSDKDESLSSDYESDKETKKKVITKSVKKTTSKKKVESSSESELSNEDENEEKQSKKKVSKPIAKSPTKKVVKK